MKETNLLQLFLITAALAAPLLPISSRAAPGDLYESDYGSGTILKFTPAGNKSTFASGLSPAGLAFDSSGNLFAADFSNGYIFKFAPSGTLEDAFGSGLNPWGLAFDSSGNLFVTNGNTILKFTPAGTQSTFASGLNQPTFIA